MINKEEEAAAKQRQTQRSGRDAAALQRLTQRGK